MTHGVRVRAVLPVVAVAVSLALAACSTATGPTPSNTLGWGFTHTQYGADSGSGRAADAVSESLAAHPMPQAQSIMGWGVGNPEPAPGEYDFRGLDARMDFIRRSGGTPVITLCCAPDWMKGGEPGTTDWSRLEVAPTPDHYADFAELAAEVARRYPDVHHFLVWNEFKGFFDEESNTWDGRAYTSLYNAVYEAVKDVDPANQVGGPYLDMGAPPPGVDAGPTSLSGPWGQVDPRVLTAFETWMREKDGADFVVVDGHATVAEGAVDEVTALGKFDAVDRWIRARTDLPLWWAEWYVEPDGSGWSAEKRTALRTAALVEFARSGVATTLFWNSAMSPTAPTDLWSSTAGADGGRPLPFLAVLQEFDRSFPPGTPLDPLPVAPPVFAVASPRTAVLVNTGAVPAGATVDGADLTLAPYEVRWVPRGV